MTMRLPVISVLTMFEHAAGVTARRIIMRLYEVPRNPQTFYIHLDIFFKKHSTKKWFL